MRGGYKDNLGMFSGFFHGDMLLDPSSEPSHRYGSCEGSQCMFSLRDKRDYLCIVFDIPSYLELCHPNHLGVASVLVRSMLFRCEDCVSLVPYQSATRSGMELVRDCTWCGLVWLVSWLALAENYHSRVKGVGSLYFVFVESACGEPDSCCNFGSVYVRACIVYPSRFVWAITSTFMHGFQNNLTQSDSWSP